MEFGVLERVRQFFQLKTYDTFEEINSDPIVANQLRYAVSNNQLTDYKANGGLHRNLYEHPSFVEMYPGLVTESAKVPMGKWTCLTKRNH